MFISNWTFAHKKLKWKITARNRENSLYLITSECQKRKERKWNKQTEINIAIGAYSCQIGPWKKVQRTVRFRLIYSFAERLIFRGEKTVAIRRLIWRKRDSRNFDKLMLDSVEGNEADRRQRRARYFAAINSFYALS